LSCNNQATYTVIALGSKDLLERGIDGTTGWTAVEVEGYDCSYFTDVDKLIDYGKNNKETPAELLERFFHFFTYEFDYHSQVLSVRTGGFLRKEEKNWVQATQGTLRDNYYLAIEDPFEVCALGVLISLSCFYADFQKLDHSQLGSRGG